MDHGRSAVEASLMNEIIEPNSIIVELTIAIETLKNSSRKERWEPMMDLIANG